jgi:hypothetical protein
VIRRVTKKHPVIIGYLAGLPFIAFLVVLGAIWGFNLRQYALLIGVCIIASVIGSIFGHWVTKRALGNRSWGSPDTNEE